MKFISYIYEHDIFVVELRNSLIVFTKYVMIIITIYVLENVYEIKKYGYG